MRERERERIRCSCVQRECAYASVRVELDDELLALEGDLADLGPREEVNLDHVLQHEDAVVRHRHGHRDPLVILR